METAFRGMRYKVETRELSYFHDDYGLKTGEDDEDEEDDDELEGSGSDGSDDDSEED
jgi:hypothetical protein